MSYRERIKHLEQLHKQLNEEIDKMERNHPHVQEQKLHDMKKQKLAYRDELSRLNRLQWEEDHERVNFDEDR